MIRRLSIALCLLLLNGCGFQLRGAMPLQKYPAIYVQGERHAEVLQILNKALTKNQVKLLSDLDPAAPSMVVDRDSLERRTLSLFPNGQVAEYELIYKVQYHLSLPGEDVRSYQIELTRDYQDDPNRALAKSKELDLMLSELRTQAASRIIRQLGRL